MTARQKIEAHEQLVRLLPGLRVLQSVCAASASFHCCGRSSRWACFLVTYFLGNRLLAKSSFWRFVLLVVTVVGSLTGTLGVGRSVLSFFGEWSLSLLIQGAAYGVAAYMNIRSFSVLSDKSVKAYFN